MLTEQPNVSGLRYRVVGHLRNCVLIGQAFSAFVSCDQFVPFIFGKAREGEVKPGVLQLGQFKAKQRVIPPRVGSNPVVGQDVGLLLDCCEVRKFDDWHLGQPELASGCEAAMPGDHTAVPIGQDWVGKAELGD